MASQQLITTAVRAALQRQVGLAWLGAAACVPFGIVAAELPVPCVSGVCVSSSGVAVPGWLTSGSATATAVGNVLDIQQLSESAVFNWRTFNISPESAVRFTQPSVDSVALNRIFQGQSTISGSLTANGRVYLLNQNGIVFGQGARVNVSGLIASSLDVSTLAQDTGVATVAAEGQAAFVPFRDTNGAALHSGSVRVQPNAEIRAGEGGQVLMFAPEISNQGRIVTPGGQTLLAAGSQVYLATSSDANLRGLLVEVGAGGGTVTNGDLAQQVGEIVAERGNITLAGLAVNQLGRLTATTTVRENGSIRLQARDGGGADSVTDRLIVGPNNGALLLGRGSTTQVSLAGSDKAVDATEQLRSLIALQGRSVDVLENAQVLAKAGSVAIEARSNSLQPEAYSATTGSRIHVASGATIDVSGASVTLPMERNVVVAELRGNELADSPEQRNGPLRGKAVSVDIRASGIRDDGSSWQGTPLGDVSGQITLIERDVSERNLTGGTVSLSSAFGDVVLASGSTVNLSGGQIQYRDGYINTTKLLGANGTVYDISQADPARQYTGIAPAGITLTDRRWGVTETFAGIGRQGRFERGYVEGKDAGSVQIVAPQAVLDGDIVARTVAGPYQLNPSQALATAQTFRPFDQLPLGARLTVGAEPVAGDTNRVTDSVVFGGGRVLPGLGSGGTVFDPRLDPLPLGLPMRLRTDLFGQHRLARVEIQANGAVELPGLATLTLPAQGELTITARQIDIAGDVTAPSGEIELAVTDTAVSSTTAGLLRLRADASLDVRGNWINDSPLLNAAGAPLAPRLIDGGSITLTSSNGSLDLATGSMLDASGGGWVRANGRIVAGVAGSINIGASRSSLALDAVGLRLGSTLRAFGVEAGGSLFIDAPELCLSVTLCGSNQGGSLWLQPESLLAAGFANVRLSSNERGLTVRSGTQFDLRQRNLLLDESLARRAPTGSSITTLGTVAELPDYLRDPMNLSLRAGIANLPAGSYDAAQFAALPRLNIESGAAILGSPGAAIALSSNSNLVVAGTVSAPGGAISLAINPGLATTDEFDSQGIWLDSSGSLLATGVAVLTPDPLGLRTGTVRDGGRVSFSAARGAVITNAGSVVDVSGASATLDLRSDTGSLLETQPVNVASNGGQINLFADQSMVLGGVFRAQAGPGSVAARGGALNLTLGTNTLVSRPPRVNEDRTITIAQSLAPTSLAPSTAVPGFLTRSAGVSTDAIRAAGFSEILLRPNTTIVQDQSSGGGARISPGRIAFAGNVSLDLPGRLQLDSALLQGVGDAVVAAPYLRIGYADNVIQQTSPLVAGGSGSLRMSGDLIDVVGNSVIDGFGAVRLDSRGDLRLLGVQQQGATKVSGSLTTDANLTLRADQIYASTLSDFSLALSGNTLGTLRIESTGGARADVLSAGSSLTLTAPTIEQSGVLRAPFGSIDLRADTLRLLPGSLTSTSAEGKTVPFGLVQAGTDWVYGLRNVSLVVGGTLPVPQQSVTLDARDINVASGAVIDISAGGDLLAYEFTPGPTGKIDVLSALARPGRYAIVPGLNLQTAPIDPQESADSTLRAGDAIHLSGGVEGLPAGDYVLLPARYALLPGAFVVEARSGFHDLPASEVIRQLDGSAVVSGYRRTQGTPFADARSSGFEIRTAAQLAKETKYTTSLASSFFKLQAARDGTATSRLPQDAGVVAFNAVTGLTLDGTLRATAAAGARGAAVDVIAERLRVTDAATATPGEVVVSAADLSALGAESILLGAQRRSTAAGTILTVGAREVVVAEDLRAPEIIVAASDSVRLTDGAELRAQGSLPSTDDYLITGDGAYLRLAAGAQSQLTRTGETGATGTLTLDTGTRLQATGGALALDASRDVRSGAALSLAQGALSLGAARINLGEVPAGESGLSLTSADLAAAGASQLALVSRSSIDYFGNFSLTAGDLTLDAAVLRGAGTGASATLTAARSLTLGNSSATVAPVGTVGTGTLALNAESLQFGAGLQTISGFGNVQLTASQSARAAGTGGLAVASDLTLATPALTAAAGARVTLESARSMTLTQAATSTAAVVGADVGGVLQLKATALSVGTRIEAAAGKLGLAATSGNLTLASTAVLDAAGRTRNFDGTVLAAPGGSINLSSATGNIVAQAGSLVTVAGAGPGAAGQLSVSAPTGSASLGGTLNGNSSTAAQGGRLVVDALALGSLSSLNASLGVQGFLQAREFRQRGPGDLTLDAAAGTMRAREVSVTADGGSVIVSGTIDASVDNGGRVRLAARDDVRISGTVRAGGSDGSAVDAGQLDVWSDQRGIRIADGATIDLNGGDLNLRLQRSSLLTLLDADASNDRLVLTPGASDVGQTTIEAFRRYTSADGVLATTGVIGANNTLASNANPLFADANTFMTDSAPAIAAALGRNADPRLRILPGVELQWDASLALGAANGNTIWDLSQWRFGAGANLPGVLTLRAGGNLTINGSLNDGFSATGLSGTNQAQAQAAFRLTGAGDSWSYRLVAGADASSANPLAVNTAGSGNFSIASGSAASNDTNPGRFRLVRTGTGSIDVAAAGNFVLGNAQSVLYSAGVAAAGGVSIGIGATGLGARTYPTNGGDIDIRVAGDVRGAPSNQLVTDWLWRVGKDPLTQPSGFATGWTVNFGRFQQNVAALGGGNLRVMAGGNIRDFSASVPSIGMPVGTAVASGSVVRVLGGGNLDVWAGGDILGGSYFIGLGHGALRAGGALSQSPTVGSALYPVLALGDAQWDVQAIGSVGIEAIVNPTLLPQGRSQGGTTGNTSASSYFSTYGEASRVSLFSTGGDLLLSNNQTLLRNVLTSVDWSSVQGINASEALGLYAPGLRAAAFGGDLLVGGRTTLYPAHGATLELFADGDITRAYASNGDVLTQSDADPTLAATVRSPDSTQFDTLLLAIRTDLHANTPVHSGDSSISHIVARTGDISFPQDDSGAAVALTLATPVRMVAGGDIIDLPLTIQHDDAADLSTIVAGGDISFTVSRATAGAILPNLRSIDVDGPGTLQVTAGGTLDLQNSAGITSRGNLINPALPAMGADIGVLVGAQANAADHAAMIDAYLRPGSGIYDSALIAEVKLLTGVTPASRAQALQLFEALARDRQRPLLEKILLAELRASAEYAASADPVKNGDYSRGFLALETLFPGANPDTKAGESNPYSGDLNLYFSRIYTQAGGDLRLLAPGGEVNAGLATPPTAFGINKTADLLGVVARNVGDIDILTYDDLQVNESRVFAVNNSDIMVWSTSGDIDAGRGAKTAISAPSPVITYDRDGRANVTNRAALAGSGIQTRVATPDQQRGDVVLAAPRGIVNAGDAGIVAGNLTIAATAVVGADNISFSGVSVGVPVDTGGLGASLAGVSAAASSASSSATMAVGEEGAGEQPASLADTAISWLEVFVIGLGEENCRPDDEDCLRRVPQP